MKTLRRIATALEERNRAAHVELKLAAVQNDLLLTISRTLAAYHQDMLDARSKNEAASAEAKVAAEKMISEMVERMSAQPTRITMNGVETPQLAKPAPTGLVVGDSPVQSLTVPE